MYGGLHTQNKKISRVVDGGGVVNLIMRQPSAGKVSAGNVNTNTTRSVAADHESEGTQGPLMMQNQHALFEGIGNTVT